MTPESRRDTISAVSVVATSELLIVLAIFIGAAVGVNVGAITSAIANWIGV